MTNKVFDWRYINGWASKTKSERYYKCSNTGSLAKKVYNGDIFVENLKPISIHFALPNTSEYSYDNEDVFLNSLIDSWSIK